MWDGGDTAMRTEEPPLHATAVSAAGCLRPRHSRDEWGPSPHLCLTLVQVPAGRQRTG